jgi:Kef-type K+ transport system membrane component KefB
MDLNPFLWLGLIFLAAYAMKLLTGRLKIPEVTGYVVGGVLLGTSAAHLLTPKVLDGLASLSTVALGIIAFMIGIELRLDLLKRLGKSIFAIVVLECVGAFVVVFGLLMLFFPDSFQQALLLAAVASATAPAATVAVIKQYRAKGILTSTIMAVVGIDDAVALIIYVLASSVVKSSLLGGHLQISKIVVSTLISLSESAILGTVAALLFALLLKGTRDRARIDLLTVTVVLGLLGLSERLGCSELLTVMVFGCVLVNRSPLLTRRSIGIVEAFSPFFLALFFILGGAHLDIRVISQIGWIGLVYFVARSIGKLGGAALGAAVGKAPPTVRKYIGFALLPQVGVALALALSINKEFNRPDLYGTLGPTMAVYIINILLFTTLITEVIGPMLTKVVLKKAGETGAAANVQGDA